MSYGKLLAILTSATFPVHIKHLSEVLKMFSEQSRRKNEYIIARGDLPHLLVSLLEKKYSPRIVQFVFAWLNRWISESYVTDLVTQFPGVLTA